MFGDTIARIYAGDGIHHSHQQCLMCGHPSLSAGTYASPLSTSVPFPFYTAIQKENCKKNTDHHLFGVVDSNHDGRLIRAMMVGRKKRNRRIQKLF